MKPNSFLIGVQKSATSSLYNWISQHPEICAPDSLKDIPFFSDDRLFKKGYDLFDDVYGKHFKNQSVVFQGNVNYIFFEKSLERIKTYNPDSKFLLVLRNPIDRAFSAYNFAVRRGLENKNIIKAFEFETQILKEGSFQELSDLTYKTHGLYAKQIEVFEKYFNLNKLCVVLFEDLKNDPLREVKRVFEFFDVESTFIPKLTYLNETGIPRSKLINKVIYKESKLKSAIINGFVNKLFSFDFKVKTKLFLGKILTKKGSKMNNKIPDKLIQELGQFYRSDILKLEEKLNLNLSHWK